MNNEQRQTLLQSIFETGKRFRFYMDEVVQQVHDCNQGICAPLSQLQTRAALSVMRNQPLSLTELAQRMNLSAPSASALVDRLVEHAIVTRETDPQDRRRVVLRIHPNAAGEFAAMNRSFQQAFERIAKRVGDENLEKWHQVMSQVNQLLDEEQHESRS